MGTQKIHKVGDTVPRRESLASLTHVDFCGHYLRQTFSHALRLKPEASVSVRSCSKLPIAAANSNNIVQHVIKPKKQLFNNLFPYPYLPLVLFFFFSCQENE